MHLCDLEPGTTYSYQAGAAGHFSPIYTFRTAPDITAHPDAENLFGVKGENFAAELASAHRRWRFDVTAHASKTDPAAFILELKAIAHV